MDTNDPNRPREGATEVRDEHPRFGKMLSFARRHPALSLIGVAGVGLVGGVELATGVLIGVGAAALLGRGPSAAPGVAHERGEHDHHLRDRARHAQHEAMERARALYQALRGELTPIHKRNGERKVEPAGEGEPFPPH